MTARISYIAIIILLITGGSVRAQQQVDAVRSFLQRTRQAYHNSDHLGFKIQYLYSNKDRPNVYTDSLSGEIQLHKDKCRFAVDGVETLITDRYTIRLMKDDKLIYLSRASHTGLVEPVIALDSILAGTERLKATVKHHDNQNILDIYFPPGHTYTHITMIADDKAGYLHKISYYLYTTGLVGKELIEEPGNPGQYTAEGRIDLIFSNYRQGYFNDSIFNEQNFFTRIDDQFVPAAAYRDYRIFLASSNL